ncbi:ATP-binding protein [Fibrella aquatica]|uniref:ATP-binding protein n=1 Tax=Fibrella aquatica TaxID=3242487 RepID=UPI003520446A
MTTPNNYQKAGFRLAHLDVLNWGTFHKKVWSIRPDGDNALVTGDIGAGKSTLIDALTTLLVPHSKITYNKAAGAGHRERNLKSYVLGAFKGEKLETSHKSKAVYLRDPATTHSVLLAVFQNENTGQTVSLAQVLWVSGSTDSVEKFFVVAEQALSIPQHFSDFATIRDLKKRLREGKNVLFDSFEEYTTQFRKLLGIRTEEALDLFYQTISMKQVANLTDFVRAQMLAKTDIEQTIDTVVRRFEELNAAHDAVQRAKRQLSLLDPIMTRLTDYRQHEADIADLNQLVDALPPYFAYHKAQLYRAALAEAQTTYELETARRDDLDKEVDSWQQRLNDLRNDARQSESGQRLERINREIGELQKQMAERQATAKAYRENCELLGLSGTLGTDEFAETKKQLDKLQQQLSTELQTVDKQLFILQKKLGDIADERTALSTEIRSLKQRKTQISDHWLTIRRRIANAADLAETDLPFVGELVQVKPTEAAWEGAIERRLRGLGLSLLVTDDNYSRVVDAMEHLTLGERVVYYRALSHDQRTRDHVSPKSLVHKVEIKEDTPFYDWIDGQLRADHNLVCCDTLDEFRRTPYALSRNGQVRSGRMRNEKDDRRNLTDRRNYILGWNNQQKINELEKQLTQADEQFGQFNKQFSEQKTAQKRVQGQQAAIEKLRGIRQFSALDWLRSSIDINKLEEERDEIANQSEEVDRLKKATDTAVLTVREKKAALQTQSEKVGGLKERTCAMTEKLFSALDTLGLFADDSELLDSFYDSSNDADAVMQQLPFWLQRLNDLVIPTNQVSDAHRETIRQRLGSGDLNVSNIERKETDLRDQLTGKGGDLDALNAKKNTTGQDVARKMQQFNGEFPNDSRDFEASVSPSAARDYEELHRQLTDDDLPRHQARFRQELKEGTINSIAELQMRLSRQEKDVSDKIEKINERLADITYDTPHDTYIQLVPEPVTTSDLQTFRNDLRNCLSTANADTELYTERKYADVKLILDRLMSQDPIDRQWRDKVTDVRQWYVFGASERFRADQSEREYYSDSSGKSGGQKEKLAYTILASAISYQYNITWEGSPRTFRLVVIDEAFGRGSKESTRYGLELFGKMNLQLLIVTPGEKIGTIERFVQHVHYVSKTADETSKVRNFSIGAYQEAKAARQILAEK